MNSLQTFVRALMRPPTSVLLLVAALLSSCDSSTPIPEDIFSDDAAASLDNSVVTGASSAEHENFWQCTVVNGAVEVKDYAIRFWSDGTGFLGDSKMEWENGDQSIHIDFSSGGSIHSTVLNDFKFSIATGGEAQFDANSDFGDNLSCLLSGPSIPLNQLFEDWGFDAQISIQNDPANSSDHWICQSSTDSSDQPTNYKFWPLGLGSANGITSYWFFDEDENIVISTNDNVSVITNTQLSKDSEGLRHFSGNLNGSEIYCGRNL